MSRSNAMGAAGLLIAAATMMAGPAVAGSGPDHGYAYGTSDGFSYVLVEGGRNSVSGSGDVSDYAKVRKLRENWGGDFLWVKLDGREYVITDLDRYENVRKAMEPVRVLGKLQGRLGARQGKLGARQGKLGAEQGRLGRRQGELGLRLAEVTLALQNRERRGSSGSALRRELGEIEVEMERLSEEQSRLGELQSALAGEQEPLAREQERLGAQQVEASRKMGTEVRRIVRDAIEDGAAKSVR